MFLFLQYTKGKFPFFCLILLILLLYSGKHEWGRTMNRGVDGGWLYGYQGEGGNDEERSGRRRKLGGEEFAVE